MCGILTDSLKLLLSFLAGNKDTEHNTSLAQQIVYQENSVIIISENIFICSDLKSLIKARFRHRTSHELTRVNVKKGVNNGRGPIGNSARISANRNAFLSPIEFSSTGIKIGV